MTIEEMIYARLCRGCPNEKRCHDDCEYCDEYLEEIEKHDNEKINQL